MNFADPNLIGLIESAALSVRCGGDPRVAIERLDLAMRMLAGVDPGAVGECAANEQSILSARKVRDLGRRTQRGSRVSASKTKVLLTRGCHAVTNVRPALPPDTPTQPEA